MHPQNQIPNNPQPNSNGAWDFLNTPEPVKPKSFFQRNKKFILIVGISFGILMLAAVLAVATGGGGTKKISNIEGPSTTVPLSSYDKDALSFQHANELNVALDEQNDGEPGWIILFAEEKDSSDYLISVKTSTEAPIYADGVEAVSELLDVDVEPKNVVTTDVVLAGQRAQKTVGEFTGEDGREYYVVYTNTQVGEQYVTASGTYLKEKQNITDSFDAMIGSIKLK